MKSLVQRTEGWAAGLVLVTYALKQQEQRSRFIEMITGAHPYFRDFFAENILHQISPEDRQFLLKTSILKHLTGSLCNAVTGQKGGTKILARLWEENILLFRLEEPGWYRYHGLFAEMLRAQLEEEFPSEIPNLHRKAADWYSVKNTPVDAIDHLFACEAWEEAAALIESVALNELEQYGEGPRLLRWLQQLPQAVLRQNKTLLQLYIRLVMLSLPANEAEDVLSFATDRIDPTLPIGSTRTVQETNSDVQDIQHSRVTQNQSVSVFTQGEEYDAVNQIMDDILQFQRDFRWDLIKAERKACAVYEAALERRHLFAALIAGGACANLALSQGYLRRSEQIAHQVLRQAFQSSDKLPEPTSIVLTALSGVYFERNQLAQANQLLERATEVDPNPSSLNDPVTIAILRSKIQSSQGDHEAALATIQAIRELNPKRFSKTWFDQDLIAYQALYSSRLGDLESAERMIMLSEAEEIQTRPFSALIQAGILMELKRNATAEGILRRLLNQYPHGYYWWPILKARVRLSIALFDQHKVNQACQVMAEAARFAAPEFFIRPFLISGPKIASLLSLVLHTENLNAESRAFLKEILTRLGYADGVQIILPRDEAVALAIATSITPREQQVLRKLSASLSNQEIAEQCSISPSTVKTHLENIYRKLGVNNRTQAVEQARMLNLV
jgi:LuxR family maltose regulon positive regulatory protein